MATYPKIGILTIFDGWHNYGQRLQAYSLCRFINENFGENCFLIDYFGAEGQSKKFKDFESENIKILKVRSREDIKKENFLFFVLGSDQVLNHHIIDTRSTWFGILNEKCKVVTYSASDGGYSIGDRCERNDFLKKILGMNEPVSIRETSSVSSVKRFAEDVRIHIDPSFLTDMETYRKIEKIPAPRNLVPGKFDFEYQINGRKIDDRKLDDGIPLIRCIGQTKDEIEFSPSEFLWLVDNCRNLYTNSFHGLAYGLLFGKKSIRFVRDERTNSLV